MTILAFPAPRFTTTDRAALAAWASRHRGVFAEVLRADDGTEFGSVEIGAGTDAAPFIVQRDRRSVVVLDARAGAVLCRADTLTAALSAFSACLPGHDAEA